MTDRGAYDGSLSTYTWQAAGTGKSAQDEQCFGYAQEYQYPAQQVHDSSSQYQPAYLQSAVNQQRFPQDASQMGYNNPTQPFYGDVFPYQSREPTAANSLSNRFDIPWLYTAGDNRRSSGSGAMPQQHPIALYQQRLQYGPTTDLVYPTLASSDPRTDLDFPQAAGAELTDQQQREIKSYGYIYSQLMKTNRNISDGRLVAAAESIFEISEWLFSHAAGLGLAQDHQGFYKRRLKLWEDFKYCWLALLQRQLDKTQTQQELRGAQNTLSEETLKGLCDRITSQCDELEKLGLVDYQMGFWEEIVDMLIKCINILARDNDGDDDETFGQGKGRDKTRTLLSGAGRQIYG